jgi:hypothetical protein
MGFGELALGGDGVAGLKLPGINAFANDVLDALIRRESLWRTGGEALGGSEGSFVGGHPLHLC